MAFRLYAVLIAGLASPAFAADDFETAQAAGAIPPSADLRTGAPVTIKTVLSPRLLLLADGQILRLLAIAPFDADESDKAAVARERLADRVSGRQGVPVLPPGRRDRYGRLRAHLRMSNDGWLQHWLAREGLVRITVPADAGEELNALLAAENVARQARRGLWAEGTGIATPQRPGRLGEFVIVAGYIEDASLINGTLYLNFGADYRTDFTFRVKKARSKGFSGARFAPRELTGQRVRVRGWLQRYNGPMIDGRHPAQLEILDSPAVDGETGTAAGQGAEASDRPRP